ncbi:hypothetical protein niasHT_014386 [Heterodera trifolii]|uniref:Vitellogenin domain-containing protein n=1 Tax=Heterodera trifolii TaxID=157864 RepID=A0ABD2LJP4_9BILA
MRTAALLVLVTAFLSVGTGGIRHSNRMSFGGFMSSANANIGTAWVDPTSCDNDAAELLQPFQQKDTEYSFIYNAQIASGLQSAEQSTANPQLKEVTRIQCLANIHFASGWHAQLRLEQCRVGQQNGKMSQPQEVQTMEAFEETNIAEQIRQQLLTPCQFSFADGVIERVKCPQDTEEWSKNAKKAVLNIIQLNLKQNNAQGLHKSSASHAEQFQQEATGQGKSFKIHEITVEGACQTMHTINKAQRIGQQQQQFNVTKTFNFKKCQKIADVANGFQADQPQAQCAQCQQYWAHQQSDQQKTNAWQMGKSDQHPCAKCDPKEVKENEKYTLFKLEQYTENNHKGIDQQAPVQQQRLVEMLRMCTEKELKQVDEHCANAAQQQKRGEKFRQMMANALGQCGTRNCVAELARKIKNGQLVQSIAVQSLLALNQLPSPSDATFDDVQQLCQSETVAGRNNSFFRLVPSLLIGVSALFAIVIYLIHNPLISSDDRPQDIDENNVRK